jgi:hypothetical protein
MVARALGSLVRQATVDPAFRGLSTPFWIRFSCFYQALEFGGLPGAFGADSLAKSPRWE